MKVVARSIERYNGGVTAKRKYGSSTITRFIVHRAEDGERPDRWVEVETGGRTAAERSAKARAEGAVLLHAQLGQ